MVNNVSFSFQRLIVSIISSPDEDRDISLKECQSIVNVVSLLAHHLQPDGQQVILQDFFINTTFLLYSNTWLFRLFSSLFSCNPGLIEYVQITMLVSSFFKVAESYPIFDMLRSCNACRFLCHFIFTDDPVLTKCLMSLLYSLTFQSKTSASLVRIVFPKIEVFIEVSNEYNS